MIRVVTARWRYCTERAVRRSRYPLRSVHARRVAAGQRLSSPWQAISRRGTRHAPAGVLTVTSGSRPAADPPRARRSLPGVIRCRSPQQQPVTSDRTLTTSSPCSAHPPSPPTIDARIGIQARRALRVGSQAKNGQSAGARRTPECLRRNGITGGSPQPGRVAGPTGTHARLADPLLALLAHHPGHSGFRRCAWCCLYSVRATWPRDRRRDPPARQGLATIRSARTGFSAKSSGAASAMSRGDQPQRLAGDEERTVDRARPTSRRPDLDLLLVPSGYQVMPLFGLITANAVASALLIAFLHEERVRPCAIQPMAWQLGCCSPDPRHCCAGLHREGNGDRFPPRSSFIRCPFPASAMGAAR